MAYNDESDENYLYEIHKEEMWEQERLMEERAERKREEDASR